MIGAFFIRKVGMRLSPRMRNELRSTLLAVVFTILGGILGYLLAQSTGDFERELVIYEVLAIEAATGALAVTIRALDGEEATIPMNRDCAYAMWPAPGDAVALWTTIVKKLKGRGPVVKIETDPLCKKRPGLST